MGAQVLLAVASIGPIIAVYSCEYVLNSWLPGQATYEDMPAGSCQQACLATACFEPGNANISRCHGHAMMAARGHITVCAFEQESVQKPK